MLFLRGVIEFSVKGTSYVSVLIGADIFRKGVVVLVAPRHAPPPDGLKFLDYTEFQGIWQYMMLAPTTWNLEFATTVLVIKRGILLLSTPKENVDLYLN